MRKEAFCGLSICKHKHRLCRALRHKSLLGITAYNGLNEFFLHGKEEVAGRFIYLRNGTSVEVSGFLSPLTNCDLLLCMYNGKDSDMSLFLLFLPEFTPTLQLSMSIKYLHSAGGTSMFLSVVCAAFFGSSRVKRLS